MHQRSRSSAKRINSAVERSTANRQTRLRKKHAVRQTRHVADLEDASTSCGAHGSPEGWSEPITSAVQPRKIAWCGGEQPGPLQPHRSGTCNYRPYEHEPLQRPIKLARGVPASYVTRGRCPSTPVAGNACPIPTQGLPPVLLFRPMYR